MNQQLSWRSEKGARQGHNPRTVDELDNDCTQVVVSDTRDYIAQVIADEQMVNRNRFGNTFS